jgi:pimeloyl-ACP methyl ester carboxylesterase
VPWLLVAVAALVGYQLLVLLALLVAWRTPRTVPVRSPGDLGMVFEDIRFPTVGGKTLHGWWIPAGKAGAPAAILVHGWGRNVERMLPYVEQLHPAGYDLLAFDARQHGLSDRDGFASLKKFSEDLRAAADEVERRRNSRMDRLGVVGLSVGGGAAIHAAAHDRRLRAVVTVGAFAHPAEAMMPHGLWRRLMAPGLPLALRFVELRVGARLDDLAPEANITRASASFLLVHGEDDSVVPVAHARRLARAAGDRAELWVMPGRGHSDPHLEPGFPARLRAFLRTHLTPAPPGDGGQGSGVKRQPPGKT